MNVKKKCKKILIIKNIKKMEENSTGLFDFIFSIILALIMIFLFQKIFAGPVHEHNVVAEKKIQKIKFKDNNFVRCLSNENNTAIKVKGPVTYLDSTFFIVQLKFHWNSNWIWHLTSNNA